MAEQEECPAGVRWEQQRFLLNERNGKNKREGAAGVRWEQQRFLLT